MIVVTNKNHLTVLNMYIIILNFSFTYFYNYTSLKFRLKKSFDVRWPVDEFSFYTNLPVYRSML